MAAKFCRLLASNTVSLEAISGGKNILIFDLASNVSLMTFSPIPVLTFWTPQNWWLTGRCFCLWNLLEASWGVSSWNFGGKRSIHFSVLQKKTIFFPPKTAPFDWHKKLGVFCLMGFRKPGFHGCQADRRSWKEHPKPYNQLDTFLQAGAPKTWYK